MHCRLSPRVPNRARKSLLFLVVAVSIAACNSAAGPPVPEGITAVSGSDQFAVVSAQAANPLVVLVTDGDGNPFAGATVTWTVTKGGGTVSDSTSTSDASGHTSIMYTAGALPGAATVVATVALVWTTSFTIHIESSSNRVTRVR
jgi:hypothetical protein